MLAWWMLVPTLLAMMVALVLPGFMWLRAGVRSSLIAIGAAPAFTFGLITVLTVLYPALEIPWEASTVMPVLGMSTVGGAVAWGLSYFHRVNGGFALNGVPFREAIGVRVPIGGRQAAIRAATSAICCLRAAKLSLSKSRILAFSTASFCPAWRPLNQI